MPLIAPSTYEPPARLWNGHLQTIIPSLFRKVSVAYVRERIDTPDDDFLDLDWAFPNDELRMIRAAGRNDECSYTPANSSLKPLVILSHGLEGSSTSAYLAGMVRHLTQSGFDCLAWHYRSCSGEMNRQQRFYHIGETGDLNLVIQHALSKGYQTIYLMGFSAGGNVTLKYIGERGKGINPAIKKAVVFFGSRPFDGVGPAA